MASIQSICPSKSAIESSVPTKDRSTAGGDESHPESGDSVVERPVFEEDDTGEHTIESLKPEESRQRFHAPPHGEQSDTVASKNQPKRQGGGLNRKDGAGDKAAPETEKGGNAK